MPLPDSESIQRYIKILITRTRQGDFVWKKLNPSMYAWESNADRPARLTLQKIADANSFAAMIGQPKTYFYLLQVSDFQESGKAVERLRIDGEVDQNVNSMLENLFALVQSGITQKGLDFFADLIGQ